MLPEGSDTGEPDPLTCSDAFAAAGGPLLFGIERSKVCP